MFFNVLYSIIKIEQKEMRIFSYMNGITAESKILKMTSTVFSKSEITVKKYSRSIQLPVFAFSP